MPKLFRLNEQILLGLLHSDPSLHRVFPDSVFCATTLSHSNSADPAITCPDREGIFSLTTGGSYDYHHGGHLVVSNHDLVIEFPPCSTILFSSTSVTLNWLPVSPGETRGFMTQFTESKTLTNVHRGPDMFSHITDLYQP